LTQWTREYQIQKRREEISDLEGEIRNFQIEEEKPEGKSLLAWRSWGFYKENLIGSG
jgi:hypothetical protein